MTHDTSVHSDPVSKNRIPHALALIAAIFTWPLLLVGGAVTVHRVGMTVPDWPTTFGVNMFYYNMFEAPWGVFAEHSHRLYGSAVGLACLGLVAVFSVSRAGWRGLIPLVLAASVAGIAMLNPRGTIEILNRPVARGLAALGFVGLFSLVLAIWSGVVRRDGVLALAWLALAAVVGQGVLGGYRVLLNSTFLAFIHGWTAQAFFALLVVLWEVTSRRWASAGRSEAVNGSLRRQGTVLLGLLAAQIVLGAWVRHYGSTLALGIHGTLALGVLAHAVMVGRGVGPKVSLLRPYGIDAVARWCLLWSVAQVALGLAATVVLWPFNGVAREVSEGQALIRVAHQGVGALLLASAVLLAMRCWRHGMPVAKRDSWDGGEAVPVGAGSGGRGMEVVS